MIKKNTKVIFEGEESISSEDLIGGIPLSKGETINFHKNGEVILYEVTDKKVDAFFEGEDQTINIIYTVAKKK